MPKANLLRLPRVAPPCERFQFTDPDHPDTPLDIPLRQLDGPLWFQVTRRANQLVGQYITGAAVADGKPMEFPLCGDPPSSIPRDHLTPELFFSAAQAEIMMELAEPNPAERHTAEEFVAMARDMPFAWPSLLMFMQQLNDRSTNPKGRAPAPTIGEGPTAEPPTE